MLHEVQVELLLVAPGGYLQERAAPAHRTHRANFCTTLRTSAPATHRLRTGAVAPTHHHTIGEPHKQRTEVDAPTHQPTHQRTEPLQLRTYHPEETLMLVLSTTRV